MTHSCETWRAGGATGLGNAVCLTANTPENSRIERSPQAQNRLRLQYLAVKLHALGGDQFAPAMHVIGGGRDHGR